ncbi:MAG: TIM barrel protein [Pseudomonadota bacterium]|nr:TIM barrel protein [Pseudomonadota bacterium]
MRTSIATVSIAGELAEKLAAISAAGFDGIEIFENDFLAFDGTPRAVGRMVRDHGLEIVLFQPFRDFEGLPEPHRTRALDRAERKFDLMQELGTDLVLVCSSVSPHALGGIDRAADDLAELGERAATRGLRIGYEALAWGRHVSDHRDAWEIVRRAGRDNVGLILDSFHTLARDLDPDSIRAIPGDRIFFIQLADAPRIQMDRLHWSRHFRNMPGEGDLDVTGFMRAVAATGYDGTVSLEIFNDQFRGASPWTIAADGHRALLYLLDQVRRAEPGIRMAIPGMPPRGKVERVEFIEFAADEATATGFETLLRDMGFRRSGRHVSKRVDLWRQGGINLVVNTEPGGFAHSAYLMHGLSICELGLKVDDAAGTAARAQALGASPFEQAVGPGELRVPGIRGVGGSVIRLVDDAGELARLWEVEFRPVDDPDPESDAGLVAVDHIAQTMRHEDMLTWLLFYTSLLETTKTPMVDVVDPSGLIRSQVVESTGGALRMILNGAENSQTLAGRFLAGSFGSAVQHVAFRSRDILATAGRLATRGFVPLAVSGNYYDDLEARFGLEPALLDRLRGAGILYDRDEGGEYLQLYSRPLGEGFFFEIVERRGDYRGYGAANAQFRIAAQKRIVPRLEPVDPG